MKNAARIGLMLLLFLFGAAAQAQATREEFKDIGEGFSVARAIQADGKTPSYLVLFPEKFLVDGTSYRDGTFKSLTLIFGCEAFKDCQPVVGGIGKSVDEVPFVFIDTIHEEPVRLLIFKLADKDLTKPIGIVIVGTRVPIVLGPVIQRKKVTVTR
jgi:hypothetical protein